MCLEMTKLHLESSQIDFLEICVLIVTLVSCRKITKKTKPGDPKPMKVERPQRLEHGPGIWCVIPLLSKLPGSVQARIIKVAGQLMEKMNFFAIYKDEEEDESEEESEDEQDEDDSDEDDENENKR